MQADFNEERLLRQFINFSKTRFTIHGISDEHLATFLRACRFDIQSALEMLEAHLNWRSEINSETLASLIPELDSFVTHAIHKTDKQGRPIYIISFKPISTSELLTRFTEYLLLEMFTGVFEKLRSRISPDTQLTVLIDLENFGLPDELDKTLHTIFSKLVRTLQLNYPEMLSKIYIINAVMHFSHLWNSLKQAIADRTKTKIVILGSRFESKLYEAIDPKNLPEVYGGECECPDGCFSKGLNGLIDKTKKLGQISAESNSISRSMLDSTNLEGLRSMLQSLGDKKTTIKEPIIITRVAADTPMNTQDVDEEFY
jgi:hypothetical protein